MRVAYDVFGEKVVARRLLRLGTRALAPEPILKVIAAQMRDQMEELFDTEGGSGSEGGWEPLAAATVAYKAREGLSPKILQATEEMRNSLTEEGLNHIEIIQRDELIFGTSDPKAKFHESGTRNMPARDPLDILTEGNIRGYVREVQRYIMGFEATGLTGAPYGIQRTFPFGV